MLTLVQVDDFRLSVLGSPEDLRAFRVPITRETLDTWRAIAEDLSRYEQPFTLFERFADLENEMEPTEEKIREFAIATDTAIQMELDRIRGTRVGPVK